MTRRRLRAIAEPIRSHYHHQSVLTFDYAARPSASDDAIDVELSGVSTTRLRAGLLADATARERLSGGSVTVGGRLILIAARRDVGLVKRFVAVLGGRFGAATVRYGAVSS